MVQKNLDASLRLEAKTQILGFTQWTGFLPEKLPSLSTGTKNVCLKQSNSLLYFLNLTDFGGLVWGFFWQVDSQFTIIFSYYFGEYIKASDKRIIL